MRVRSEMQRKHSRESRVSDDKSRHQMMTEGCVQGPVAFHVLSSDREEAREENVRSKPSHDGGRLFAK